MLKRLLGWLGITSAPIRGLHSEKRVVTVNLFAEEPWLMNIAKSVIQELDVPWQCTDTIKQLAKNEALRCIRQGVKPDKVFIKTLVPLVFHSQRDARHGIAKIAACGMGAVDRFRYKSVATHFEWSYCEPICDFPEHAQLQWRIFSLENGHKGEFPAGRYGCRCLSSAHFKDD